MMKKLQHTKLMVEMLLKAKTCDNLKPFADCLFGISSCREALLAEMGVAMREDGGTVGVFSPKKVRCLPLLHNSLISLNHLSRLTQ